MALPIASAVSKGRRVADAARQAGSYFAAPQRRPLRRVLLAGGLLGGGVLLIRNLSRSASQKKAFEAVATSQDARVASRYAAHLRPKGGFWSALVLSPALSAFDWLKDRFTSTDVDPVKLVDESKDWKAVMDYYQAMTRGNSLMKDLQKDLSSNDFQNLSQAIARQAGRIDQEDRESQDAADTKTNRLEAFRAQIMAKPANKVYLIADPDRFRWNLYVKKGGRIYNSPRTNDLYSGPVAQKIKYGVMSGHFSNDGRRAFVGVYQAGNRNVLKYVQIEYLDTAR